jgi:uncharacterized protein YukE
VCNTLQRAATQDDALQHRAARVRRRYRAELQRVNEAMRELEDELEVVKNTLAKCAQVRRSVPSRQAAGAAAGSRFSVRSRRRTLGGGART